MRFRSKYVLWFLIFIIGTAIIYSNGGRQHMVRTRSEEELRCDDTTTDWNNMQGWQVRNIPPSKKIMSSSVKNEYYRLLKDIDEILTTNNIKYVLGAGTLLGSYRHGGIIPWDDDGDICIRWEDHARLKSLSSQFQQKGITLQNGCLTCWSGVYKEVCEYLNDRSMIDENFTPISMEKPCKDTQYFAVLKRGDQHIDVFHLIPILDIHNRRMYTVYGNNRLISEEQANAMFSAVKCPFGPLQLNCPSNTKELLCYQYKNNLQFPTLAGINNKSLIHGMWSGRDHDVSYFTKNENNDYIINNFR